MTEFYRLEEGFAAYESGTPRLQAIRDAIRLADERQALPWRFRLRFDYLKESIFCGDRYFAMLIFPELLDLYDRNEALQQDAAARFDMLVAFKWIVEAAPEFPQISKAEIDSYFRLFRQRLLENGCSLSIYYMKRNLFYLHCDRSIAAMCFYRFLEESLDAISDGGALYHDQQVIYYLSIGDEEKALHAAEPIFSGRLTSNALPQATYHEFIKFYAKAGEYDRAMAFAEKTEHRVTGNPYYLDIIGSLLRLYAVTEPARGMALFLRNLPLWEQSRNPNLRMLFALGACHLFRAEGIPALENPVTIAGTAFSDSPALYGYFYPIAKDYAQKFDARNGTEDFMQELAFQYPQPTKNKED